MMIPAALLLACAPDADTTSDTTPDIPEPHTEPGEVEERIPATAPAIDTALCEGQAGRALLAQHDGVSDLTDALTDSTGHTLDAPGVLYLCGGTWTTPLQVAASDVFIVGTDDAQLSGASTRTPITIEGDGHSVSVHSLTIADGLAQPVAPNGWNYGGGLLCSGSSRVALTDVTLRSNGISDPLSAQHYGGGVALLGCDGTLDGVTAEDNEADQGAVVYAEHAARLSITDTTLTGSYGTDEGAVSAHRVDTVRVLRSTFTDNTVDEGLISEGAALSIWYGALQVEDSTFTRNEASDGGAIALYFTTAEVLRSTFTDNWAYEGGAIRAFSSTLTLEGADLTSNAALYHGGGLFLKDADVTVEGGRISGNVVESGGYGGAGAFVGEDSRLSLTDNGVSGNEDEDVMVDTREGYTLTEGAAYECSDEVCVEVK